MTGKSVRALVGAWAICSTAALWAQDRPVGAPPGQDGAVTVRDAIAALQRGDAGRDAPAPIPIGGVVRWFGVDDYPPAALRAAAQGRVVASLRVDAQGRVAGCVVKQSSGSADLDKATCDIARKRATFTPAHDTGGRAIAGTYTLPVRWQLPSVPPVSVDIATTLVSIGPDGSVLSCTAVAPSLLGSICGAFPAGRKLDVPEAMRGKVIAVGTLIRPLAE